MYRVFTPEITKNDIASVTKTLKNNEISGTFGKEIIQLEKNFSNFVGTRYASTLSSGTTALELAVRCLNLPKNSEILISSNTNIATALACVKNKFKPVPVDSSLSTWNLDENLLKKYLTKKTKAIIVVHFLGNPVDMKKILQFSKKHNLKVIEDCAEAHGAVYDNKVVGSFGDIGCFSFYSNKVITSGEGGMITTNSLKIYKQINLLKNLSFSKIRFKHNLIGYNFRLSNIQCSLALSQLRRIKNTIKKKIRIAKNYEKYLDNNYLSFQHVNSKSKNIYWMYGIVLNKNVKKTKNRIIKELLGKGIETRSFFYSMRNQPCLKKYFNLKSKKTPNSDFLWNNGIYLPSSHNLKEKDIFKISKIVNEVVSSR